jgi:hypothetical protein
VVPQSRGCLLAAKVSENPAIGAERSAAGL